MRFLLICGQRSVAYSDTMYTILQLGNKQEAPVNDVENKKTEGEGDATFLVDPHGDLLIAHGCWWLRQLFGDLKRLSTAVFQLREW